MKTITLTLDTPGDVPLLRAAIEDRHEHLAKLADKTGDGGRYSREAQTISRDALRLRNAILPRIADQSQLTMPETPLVEVLAHAIGSRVRSEVRFALKKSDAKSPKDAHALSDEFERAVGSIAELAAKAIAPLLSDVAEEGYDAGRRSLQDAPDVLARRVIEQRAA